MANETITGKIFTLKDPTGTYNRFPRTVMEAVLGLNTYLQNQFSSLADIYMPIEGITETKPLQEFVYRACPSTIKAKSLTLDRIYGKTLAWNNIVINGDFSNGTTDWIASSGTISASNNILTWSNASGAFYQQRTFIVGHLYYICAGVKCDSTFEFGASNVVKSFSGSSSSFSTVSNIIQAQAANGTVYFYPHSNTSMQFKQISCVDLTLMFGAGNEPSTVAEFESMFPGYHSYSAGKLISNDAESIETVGFNQWDEEVENGTINTTTGALEDSGLWRCKNPIAVFPNTNYYFSSVSGKGIMVFWYDAAMNYIGYVDNVALNTVSAVHQLTSPANAHFMRIRLFSTYTTGYTKGDICINLSDPAKNGTYEPYRKSTLHLGLNNIRVKSHNIWDEDTESGGYDVYGNPAPSNEYIRTKNHIPIIAGKTYYIRYNGTIPNGRFASYIFDSNDNMLLRVEGYNKTFDAPANSAYMLFNYKETTYKGDICINVSSSFNGQYEPHGDITITGGLKSAGSVKDEIVGNKYIKRVGSVDLGTLSWTYDSDGYVSDKNNFYSTSLGSVIKIPYNNSIANIVCSSYTTSARISLAYNNMTVATGTSNYVCIHNESKTSADLSGGVASFLSGVMLYYELATPVEYELVSPLVPTVKAGTTEARISPNADGLSAPMVADMTYDAQANNDSASAQYALTAGRLLNSHKFWGQDFDGRQDVSGALTGVTNLNSLLYLGSSNVGIGQSSPAYKLDVNGTFRATGAATFGSTISASGNISTTGQLISTKATGTAPLSVASTTRVANLNADLLDGYEASDFIATLQSLWSQIDSVSAKVNFDFLNITSLCADVVSACDVYLNKLTTTGAVSVGGALSVGGTASVSGLLTAVSGIKMTTTKKIWFGDTYYIELKQSGSSYYLETNAAIVSTSFITAGAANS